VAAPGAIIAGSISAGFPKVSRRHSEGFPNEKVDLVELPVRKGPLGSAQHWVWLLDTLFARKHDALPPARFDVDVPDGVSPRTVRRALIRLADRHEALRTVIRPSAEGQPQQLVHATVEPDLVLVGPGEKIPDAALTGPAFDGFPLRALIHTDAEGQVSRLTLQLVAMAADGTSLGVLSEELGELLAAETEGREPELAEAPAQPVDQAVAETSGAQGAAAERALRHWERSLADGPHAGLPFRWNRSLHWQQAPVDGACVQTVLTSRDLGERCAEATRKYRTTMPTLLHALTVVMLTGWTRRPTCALGVVSANRTSPELMGGVGRYATEMRLVADLREDPAFSVVLRRLRTGLMTAYSNGVFDVGELVMAEARASARIGARISTSAIFEFHNTAVGAPVGEGDQARDPDIAQAVIDYRTPNVRFDVSLVDGALRVILRCPDVLLPPDAARAFCHQLSALVDAVLTEEDPRSSELAALVDLPRPWDGPRWVAVRDSWVDLDQVTALLREHPRVVEAGVFVVEGAGGDGEGGRLAAHVRVEPTCGVGPAQLGEHMRDMVAHHPATVVPHEFVVHAVGPDDPSDLRAWAELPSMVRGAGDPDGAETPDGPAEQALVEAFVALHPGRPVALTQTYAQAHGRFLLIPALLDRLAAEGYDGLELGDFIGMASLRRVAAKMARRG
jgi:hypothetical protein